jgi:hypothetical protein
VPCPVIRGVSDGDTLMYGGGAGGVAGGKGRQGQGGGGYGPGTCDNLLIHIRYTK